MVEFQKIVAYKVSSEVCSHIRLEESLQLFLWTAGLLGEKVL